MNVNGLNSNDSSNPLEQIVLYGDKADAKQAAKQKSSSDLVELDQAEANQFNSIKSKIREAKDFDRAAMIKELRQKFLTGELNNDFSGIAVADAMLADGYGDYLFS